MHPIRVLLVDPDERRARWLQELLALRGHSCVHVTSGERAIDQFILQPTDAILIEHALPGRDGVATIEAIRWAPGGRSARVVLMAREEPDEAPLGMLAAKIEAVRHLVGDLALSDVRLAFDAMERSAATQPPPPPPQSPLPSDSPSPWSEATTVIGASGPRPAAWTAPALEGGGLPLTGPQFDPPAKTLPSLAPPPEIPALTMPELPPATGFEFEDRTTFERAPGFLAALRAQPLRSAARFGVRPAATAFRGRRTSDSPPSPMSSPTTSSEQSAPAESLDGAAPAGPVLESRADATAEIPGELLSEAHRLEDDPLDATEAEGVEEVSSLTGPAVPAAAPPTHEPTSPPTSPPASERAPWATLDVAMPAETHRSRRAPEWSGTYTSTSFPMVLRRIADNRASGALTSTGARERPTLDSRPPTKVVYFRAGVPVEVRSNLVDECLGQFLLRKKRITVEALEASVTTMRERGGRQGEILVAMGALHPVELGELLGEQARQKLFDHFGWTSGSFEFTSGIEPPREGVSIEMALPEIVYEGVCAAMPATALFDAVRARLDAYVVPDPVRLARFARVRFPRELRIVLEQLDGTQRVRDVLPQAGRTAVAQLIYALEALGAVTYEPSVSPRASGFVASPTAEASGSDAVRVAPAIIAGARPPPAASLEPPVGPPAPPASAPPLDGPGLDASVARMTDAERLFRKGNRALERGDSLGAAEAFGRSVQLCPDEGEFVAYHAWARHCLAPRDPVTTASVIAELRTAVSLAPDLHVTHLLLARVLEGAGAYAEARSSYSQVLQLDDENTEAREALRRIAS